MRIRDYEVLVAGAGPAGSSVAITAARVGLRVLLIERQELPFKKVCGEFLSAHGVDLWRSLTGRDLPPACPCLSTARFFSSRDSTPIISIDPPAAGLSRSFLDGHLIEAASRAGVDVEMGARVVSHSRAGGSLRTMIRSSKGGGEVFAGCLVLATGRPVLERRGPWWLGRKAACNPVATEADLEMYLLPEGGYVGLCPVESGKMSLCALTRDAGDSWLRHPALGKGEVEVGRSVARFVLGLQDFPDDDAFRVGDSLAVWPPVVGDGITVAMASGILLGRLIGQARRKGRGLTPREWIRAWREAFGWKLRLSLLLHQMADGRIGRVALFSLARLVPSLGGWMARATRSSSPSHPSRPASLI